ncbi:MAG TPA: hypothetical protein VKV77_03520 [Methylovirgula sp.]|nr:hypothetical protein [Methylovirgula sp.]
MPIQRHFENLVFGPEEISRMTAAYESALDELDLADRTDPLTEIIAKKIVEVAQTGEINPARITRRALLELDIRPAREGSLDA